MKLLKGKKSAILLGVVIIVASVLSVLNGVVFANPQTAQSVGEVDYRIQISGISDMNLEVVEMPVSIVEPVEFIDGQDVITYKRPGLNSCTNLVIAANPNEPALNEIWDWFDNVKNGSYDRRSAVIDMVDTDGQVITRYVCMGVWPTEWTAVEREEQGNVTSAVEQVTFVVEQIFRQP